jgi:branched-chain amino acid transport system permease protein
MSFKTILLLLAGIAASYAATLVLPQWLTFIVAISLGKGLVVLGLVLLMRAGLVSFGQGLYYCVGGYAAGLLSQHLGVTDVIVVLVVATAACVALAAVVGLLLCRYREIFFAMFSLAFSMILYGILARSQQLGSTDGFNVAKPTLLGWAPATEDAVSFVVAIALVLVFVLGAIMHRYTKAMAGFSGEAVRENEIRVEYLGGSAFSIIYTKYITAAGLAGIGGAVTAMATGHVDPAMAYWTTSGEFVFIALMGGISHVAAPLFGAVLFELVRSYAFSIAPFTWQMILGTALLLIIIFLPKGLWSLVDKTRGKSRRGEGGAA